LPAKSQLVVRVHIQLTKTENHTTLIDQAMIKINAYVLFEAAIYY